MKIKNCTAENMHSLLQAQSCDMNIEVDNVTITNCKNGISFGNTAEPTLTNSTIDVTGYGVRTDGDASRGNLVMKGNEIKANIPVAVRKLTTNYSVAFEGENTLTAGQSYEVILTNSSEEDETVVPTGTYTITGAENFNVYPGEGGTAQPAIATSAAQLTAFLANANISEILLGEDAEIEGTFTVKRAVKISSVNADKKATIIGRVNIASASPTFKDVIFDRNETDSNAEWNREYGWTNWLQYESVVMAYGGSQEKLTFENCEFFNVANGKTAITTITELVIDNCYFKGTGSAIYACTNLSITNSEFDFTQGSSSLVVYCNGLGETGGKFIFTGNKAINEDMYYIAGFLTTTAHYPGTYHFNIQNNTGFDNLGWKPERVANKTYADGSEKF